jgi:hypothetical protein
MRNRRYGTVLLLVVAIAVWVAVVLAQGGLAALGVQEAQAKGNIVYAIVHGRVDVSPARKALKAAAPAARAGLVKTAMAWARTYTESAAFKADYDSQRAKDAPKPLKKRNVDEELAKQKAEREKHLEEVRKNFEKNSPKMSPETRAAVEADIAKTEASNKQMDSDPKMIAMARQSLEIQIADEQKQYDQRVARHEKRFPADPNVMIADRLRQFLEVSKDVDFGAKLVTANGRSRFEDPVYERKSDEWKLCYRAGKDAVDAAREFAQSWLAALGTK